MMRIWKDHNSVPMSGMLIDTLAYLTRVKFWQIILSALTASGVLGVLFVNSFYLKVITALVALLSTALTSYMQDFDPGAAAQKHRDTAAAIWPVRESYLSLLTDTVAHEGDIADLRKRRDALQEKLAAIYMGAPHTTRVAYLAAQPP